MCIRSDYLSGEEILLTLAAVGLLGVLVIMANLADRDNNRRLRRILLMTVGALNVFIVGAYGVMQVFMAYAPADTDFDPPAEYQAWAALILAVVVGGLASALLVRPWRDYLTMVFPARRSGLDDLQSASVLYARTPDNEQIDATDSLEREEAELATDFSTSSSDLAPQRGTPLFPQMLNYYTTDSTLVLRQQADAISRPVEQSSIASDVRVVQNDDPITGFDPGSLVHMLALILIIYMLGIQAINFILSDGLAGVAEGFEGGLSAWDLIINGLPLIVIPVLGVGAGMRRSWRAVIDRLALGWPSIEGLLVASGVVLGLFFFVATVSAIWMSMVSEATYEEQTQASEALASSVTTVGLAFLLAAVASITEEIAFRGALQPIIGFWATAIVFALTHMQYTMTPATLIILGVALGFGWLRRRYNTTIAIYAHFVYNFVPLALSMAVPDEMLESVYWWLHMV